MTRRNVGIAFISMTSTLRAFISEAISVEEMQNKDNVFLFSCWRCHVLGSTSGNTVPFEATWNNKVLECMYDGDRNFSLIHIDAVDTENRLKVRHFIQLVREADEDGRVIWQYGRDKSRKARIGHVLAMIDYHLQRRHYAGERYLEIMKTRERLIQMRGW